MKREAVGIGPTVEEALDIALDELGVQQDAVEYEVVQEGGGKKLFGLGSEKEAEVRVWLKQEAAEELEAAKNIDSDIPNEEEDETLSPVPSRERTEEDRPELTDEELDQIADAAAAIIQEVLKGLDIEASVEEYEGDEGELILDIVGDDLAVLIGRHGRTLDALQTLVGAMVNRSLGFRHPVVVDVEGYRSRRREKLEGIGRRAAEKALRQGQPVKLRPMSSYERRIIHVILRDDSTVNTASEGDEPFRYVVIKPR